MRTEYDNVCEPPAEAALEGGHMDTGVLSVEMHVYF